MTGGEKIILDAKAGHVWAANGPDVLAGSSFTRLCVSEAEAV